LAFFFEVFHGSSYRFFLFDALTNSKVLGVGSPPSPPRRSLYSFFFCVHCKNKIKIAPLFLCKLRFPGFLSRYNSSPSPPPRSGVYVVAAQPPPSFFSATLVPFMTYVTPPVHNWQCNPTAFFFLLSPLTMLSGLQHFFPVPPPTKFQLSVGCRIDGRGASIY